MPYLLTCKTFVFHVLNCKRTVLRMNVESFDELAGKVSDNIQSRDIFPIWIVFNFAKINF